MDVMVLNCWVPATNDIDLASKDLDQLGEVGERTGQAVDPADEHDFDLVGLDIGRQPLKGRTIKATAGIGWVIIPLRKRRLRERASSARRCAPCRDQKSFGSIRHRGSRQIRAVSAIEGKQRIYP